MRVWNLILPTWKKKQLTLQLLLRIRSSKSKSSLKFLRFFSTGSTWKNQSQFLFLMRHRFHHSLALIYSHLYAHLLCKINKFNKVLLGSAMYCLKESIKLPPLSKIPATIIPTTLLCLLLLKLHHVFSSQ